MREKEIEGEIAEKAKKQRERYYWGYGRSSPDPGPIIQGGPIFFLICIILDYYNY